MEGQLNTQLQLSPLQNDIFVLGEFLFVNEQRLSAESLKKAKESLSNAIEALAGYMDALIEGQKTTAEIAKTMADRPVASKQVLQEQMPVHEPDSDCQTSDTLKTSGDAQECRD